MSMVGSNGSVIVGNRDLPNNAIGSAAQFTIRHNLDATNTINADAEVLTLERFNGSNSNKWPNNATFNLGSYGTDGNAESRLDLRMSNGYSYDLSNVMTWLANGNVGIGNTAPTAKLDVTGNVKFSGALMPAGQTGSAGQVLVSSGGAGAPVWTTKTTADTPNIYTADGTLTGARVVTQNGNNLSFTGGNVGINETNPSEKLQVNGNIKANGGSVFANYKSIVAGQGATMLWNGATDVVPGIADQGMTTIVNHRGLGTGGFTFAQTSDNTTYKESMRIDGNGNVGIGSTAPTANLDILNAGTGGSVLFSSPSNIALKLHNDTPGKSVAQVLKAVNSSGVEKSVIMGINPDYSSGGLNGVFALNINDATNSFLIDLTSGGFGLGGIPSLTNKLRVEGNSEVTGSLVIGGTTPTEKLDVLGNVKFSGALMPAGQTGSAGQVLVSNGAAAPVWITKTTADTPNIYTADGTLTGARTVSGITATNTLKFLAADAADAAITVGTTTGASGGVYFGNTSHGVKRGFPVTGAGNNVGLYTSSGNIYLSANGADINRFVLNNSGSVGIGTADPSQALDVNNGGLRVGSHGSVANQGAYLQWNKSGSEGETWLINQKGAGQIGGIRFGKSTTADLVTEWARFNEDGNFGIGFAAADTSVADPKSTLTVEGSFSLTIKPAPASYTVTDRDATLLIDGAITLPSAAGSRGRIYTFVYNVPTSGTNCVITTAAATPFQDRPNANSTTWTLDGTVGKSKLTVQSIGTLWVVISKN